MRLSSSNSSPRSDFNSNFGSATPLHAASLALAGLLSLAVAVGIGRFAYTPILPYMAAGLALGKSEVGLIASANYAGYLLGALAAATQGLPGNPRGWLLGALAASGLSTCAMALTTDMTAFLLLRFLGGAAGALVMVFASSLLMDRLAAAGRDGWADLIYAGVGTGIAISSLAVPASASGIGDWQSPWLFCGALSIALSIPVAVLLRGPLTPASISVGSRVGQGEPGIRSLVVAYGLSGFGYVITATFVSDMMRSDPVLRPAEYLVWLCVGLAAAPSVVFWGWVGRRWSVRCAFAVACLVAAGGVAMSVLVDGIWPVLLAAVLLGGTFVGLTALGLVSVRRTSVGNPRRNLALMTAAFGLGQMVGPTFAGVLHDSLGSYQVPSLLAAFALVAAAVLGGGLPRRQCTK